MNITRFKQNDRLPDYTATLLHGAGTIDEQPIDLTVATAVRFLMRDALTGTVKVNSTAAVVTPLTGDVAYAWAVNDLDTNGDYQVEWEITFGVRKLTVPAADYDIVRVVDDIA